MLQNNKGFSLIELMIVVVIIGILAAVAIPSYNTFQQRAKASEAKVILAGIYTAEKVYFAEKSLYSAVLATINFTAPAPIHYTAVGFTGNTIGGVVVAGCKVVATATFIACAQITAGATAGDFKPATDWTINQEKVLGQVEPTS